MTSARGARERCGAAAGGKEEPNPRLQGGGGRGVFSAKHQSGISGLVDGADADAPFAGDGVGAVDGREEGCGDGGVGIGIAAGGDDIHESGAEIAGVQELVEGALQGNEHPADVGAIVIGAGGGGAAQGGDDGGGDALLCSPLLGGGIHALGGGAWLHGAEQGIGVYHVALAVDGVRVGESRVLARGGAPVEIGVAGCPQGDGHDAHERAVALCFPIGPAHERLFGGAAHIRRVAFKPLQVASHGGGGRPAPCIEQRLVEAPGHLGVIRHFAGLAVAAGDKALHHFVEAIGEAAEDVALVVELGGGSQGVSYHQGGPEGAGL